jgi:hypothetical protein
VQRSTQREVEWLKVEPGLTRERTGLGAQNAKIENSRAETRTQS